MDFADGFTDAGLRAGSAGESTDGVFADDHRSSFGFVTYRDLIGAVDFEIGENTVLEDEPPGTPSPAVVDPLVQNARDPIPHNVVDHDLPVIPNGQLPREPLRR